MIATCDVCGRLQPLTNTGVIARHSTVGPIIRARTGKRRRVCKGSGRAPRQDAKSDLLWLISEITNEAPRRDR